MADYKKIVDDKIINFKSLSSKECGYIADIVNDHFKPYHCGVKYDIIRFIIENSFTLESMLHEINNGIIKELSK